MLVLFKNPTYYLCTVFATDAFMLTAMNKYS